MRKSLLIIVVAMALPTLVPLQSHAAGCEVLATGHPSTPGTCTYVATGPGEFSVVTTSGFRIEIVSPEERKGTLVAHVAAPNNVASGPWAEAGTLETQAGDLVAVAITVGSQTLPNGSVYRWQDGFATARDS